MGCYLAIGLNMEICIQREKSNITLPELIEEMKRQQHFRPELYTSGMEKDGEIFFTLKSEILEQELIPFLEKLYPQLYPDSEDKIYYDGVTQELESIPSQQWLEYAKGNPKMAFRWDPYDMFNYIDLHTSFRAENRVSYTSILLSMEGKIVMECYGRQFDFFKRCIMCMFPEFALAGALRVYISG